MIVSKLINTERAHCGMCSKKTSCPDAKPDHWCESFVRPGTTLTCKECVNLHTPSRNKTCYNDYGRKETDPICSGITTTRRYSRKPRLVWIESNDFRAFNPVNGEVWEAISTDCDQGILLTTSIAAAFGLVVKALSESQWQVQIVRLKRGGVVVDNARPRTPNVAFAGEAFALDINGDLAKVPGDLASLLITGCEPEDLWRQRTPEKAETRGVVPNHADMGRINRMLKESAGVKGAPYLANAIVSVSRLMEAGVPEGEACSTVAGRLVKAQPELKYPDVLKKLTALFRNED